ncbi:glycosyl hydrolase [Mariniflexile sp. AS56]|uniref:glycosyl hydrolase n=1 Tax=Mariniflexile sp. AS56 TaxID=3063957 RepID=UPI0026EAAE2F|nr:glycosyl hydrolase [Mariniflexile sp. AS56]MDO7172358.1 glycosyl hydrolase [Mariniflexile sp. AS56]
MKIKLLYAFALFCAMNSFAQTDPCGTKVDDTFEEAGALPNGWTEYNTSGRVTVEGGKLKFNHNTTKPSAYRTFSPTSSDLSFSFDVSASRNSVNCQIHLVSSTGKYLSSIAVGVGPATIKYATTMEGGVPSGFIPGTPEVSFKTNTVYTLSAQVDFTSKKVNIYSNGELMATDVPFLETAEDVAEIDIQLIYMYSNNGQFYFDNISLISGEANRLQLTSNVNAAENLVASASIGTSYNQYPQSAVDAFQLAIDDANAVLANCDSASNTIDTSMSDLQAAQDILDGSRVNDPVLKVYDGFNFSGEEHEIYCGYYNGGLGAYEDWAVSFTLEKGYMATFAQDVNGLGVSKIYIAQDHAIEINLPADLQRSISFIRVSPWFPVGKKGSLGGDIKWSSADNYNTTWHYNWGLESPSQSSGVQFVPMAWSKSDNWTSLEKMKAVGENMSFNNLMAFNEPDNSGQSNLTVEEALDAYPKLLASGLRLGAPGVENVQYSSTNDSFNEDSWIKAFMDGCVARGYRVDFIPAHDYVRRSKSSFLERFKGLHDRYNLPIWVTEYNYGNPNMGSANITVEQGYTNIKGLTEVLEGADFVERYNWYYFFGAASGIGGITDGELNITGQFYRDLESQNPSYIQEVYAQGQLSTSDFDRDKGLSISPNPVTKGIITVNYRDSYFSKDTTIRIFNSSGQELKKLNDASKQIDVSKFSNGIYFIQFISSETNVTKKIIVNQ